MINPAFIGFQEEASLLGAMVIGYGELDLTFANMAGIALGERYAVLEACHSVRSESARLKIADALAASALQKHELKVPYEIAHRGMRFCLKLRNQYAHAQWGDLKVGYLSFTNAEDAFKRPLTKTKWKKISIELLKEQEAFFENTRKWLIYLEITLENIAAGQPKRVNRPEKVRQPKLSAQMSKSNRKR